MSFVGRIIDALFPKRASARVVETMVPDALASLVSAKVIAHPEADIVALLPYHDPLVSSLIVEAKYHDSEAAFLALGAVLADYLDAFLTDEDSYEPRPLSLIPIPLHTERLNARGYNQAERIAKAALTSLGLPGSPSSSLLWRTRSTPSQAHLPRNLRLKNLEEAFEAAPLNEATTYVLIDDVVTTGTTLAKAAEALRRAGAVRVEAVALAH